MHWLQLICLSEAAIATKHDSNRLKDVDRSQLILPLIRFSFFLIRSKAAHALLQQR